jgi:hypothetical protein
VFSILYSMSIFLFSVLRVSAAFQVFLGQQLGR